MVISCMGKEWQIWRVPRLRGVKEALLFPATGPLFGGKGDRVWKLCARGCGQRGRGLIMFATGQASP